MPAFFLLNISCAKEEAQPQALLQMAIIRKMHGANRGVPGAAMKECRGSSSSTVGHSNSEIRAKRERVGRFGSAGAGREQQGNVTWGPVG